LSFEEPVVEESDVFSDSVGETGGGRPAEADERRNRISGVRDWLIGCSDPSELERL
jgi:hypothetical protein